MTMTVELKPDVEAGLLAQARASGLSLEAYVEKLLQERSRAESAPRRPAGRKSLAQLFAESPFKGLSLKLERDPDTGRPAEL
jgi:hypothetical protein